MNIALTQETRQTKFWIFASAYGVASLFYAANFYSYGISFSFISILLPIIFLGPLLGMGAVFVDAALLKITGILLGGKGDFVSLQNAVAYSRTPSLILLPMWMMMSCLDSSSVFIQDASNGSAVMIVLSSTLVYIYSFFLLSNSLQKVQRFRWPKAFCNTFVVYLLSFIIYATVLFVGRYIYISLF